MVPLKASVVSATEAVDGLIVQPLKPSSKSGLVNNSDEDWYVVAATSTHARTRGIHLWRRSMWLLLSGLVVLWETCVSRPRGERRHARTGDGEKGVLAVQVLTNDTKDGGENRWRSSWQPGRNGFDNERKQPQHKWTQE